MEPQSDHPDPNGVLAAAKAGNDEALRQAINSLVADLLLPAARAQVGGRGHQADFLPDSIVQSVIVDELPVAIERCSSESHLRARLVTAIKHKVIDRTRRGGKAGLPVQFGQLSGGVDVGQRVGDQRGPLSDLASQESAEEGEHRFGRFAERLLALAPDPADQTLLREYVLGGNTWAAAAGAAGLSEPAARKRLSRMREQLLPALCQPLRDHLDGTAWAVAEGLFIRRMSPVAISSMLSVSEERIERAIATDVLPVVRQLFGAESLEPIWRIVGRLSRG